MTVAQLLSTSRQAHQRYRSLAGRIGKDGKVNVQPRLGACGDAIREALAARTDADALDPAHTDHAWLDDAEAMRSDHASLVQFYVAYLAPEALEDVSA